MRNGVRRMLTLLTVTLAGSACATSEQWTEWRQHSTHFASSEHFDFSMRHRGASPTPRVSQRDVEKAKADRGGVIPLWCGRNEYFTN